MASKTNANNSRWAQMVSNKPTGRLNDHAIKFWNEMKIEFLTHYQTDDSKFQIIVKSKISHRKSKWASFSRLIQAYSLSIFKTGRYKSPIDELKGSRYEEEIGRNIFTIDMNEGMPWTVEAEEVSQEAPAPPDAIKKKRRSRILVITRLLGMDLDCSQLFSSDGKGGSLIKKMSKIFKREWPEGNLRNLQGYLLLEVHRRLLKLEHFLSDKRIPDAMMPSGRSDAFAASKYLIVEPSTLCVPAILCHLRGACPVQDNAGYRVRAVIASIVPLVRYGSELSQLAQQHVSPALLAQASGVLFNWPFDFLPETARASLAAPSQQRDDPSVARRLEKEQDDLRESRRTGKVPAQSPLVDFFTRMNAAAKELLATDTYLKGHTRWLPPTPSMPDAEYDPDAFMAQLPAQRQAGRV